MRRTVLTTLVLTAMAVGVLSGPPGTASTSDPGARAAGAPAPHKGSPGTWTKISTGTVGITSRASMVRTADGVLHVVYAKQVAGGAQIGHTAISRTGTTGLQNDVLSPAWSVREQTPTVLAGPSGGLRVAFGGKVGAGFWANGRMYTATAPASGAPWTLPAEAIGNSIAAHGSRGTAATTLLDGTPIAGFALDDTITWHVGTADATPDQSFQVAGANMANLGMARTSTGAVWIAWYSLGSSSATTGAFVRQVLPSLGPILKAPGSSVGTNAQDTGRAALAARGSGVVLAYCTGTPCASVKLWKPGAASTLGVPSTRFADKVALATGPSGRLWVAWSNNLPTIQAVRTNKAGTKLGVVRRVGMPRNRDAVHSVAVEGTSGRGDVVINVGDAFWHTQVLAGLTLKASPASWRHGTSRQVTFTVTDAGDKVSGARVQVGSRRCTTAASGTCTITFPRSVGAGRLTARATKAEYGAATKTLRVT